MSKIIRRIRDEHTPQMISARHTGKYSPRTEANLESQNLTAQQEAQQILTEAQKHADQILATAQAESEAILLRIDQEVGSIRERAYDEGFNKGLEDGRERARTLINEAEAIKTSIHNERKNIFTEHRDKLVELSFSIAEQIINIYVDKNDEVILQVIEGAIQEIVEAQRVVIRVSPGDYGVVIEHEKLLTVDALAGAEVMVLADSELNRGECLVKTENVEVDARIETGLKQLREALQEISS